MEQQGLCKVFTAPRSNRLDAPDGREHRWLTREYGTFGPRRPDDRSGKPFTLKKGESITQRVGVLVHNGDAGGGRVRERYKKYVKGGWK